MERFWILFLYLLTRELIFVHLTLQEVMISIIYTNYPLLNYLLHVLQLSVVAKLYTCDCRRSLTPPIISAFKLKAKVKYIKDETTTTWYWIYEKEKLMCVKTSTDCMDKFNKIKWDLWMGYTLTISNLSTSVLIQP